MSISIWLKTIRELKQEGSMTYVEAADRLRVIADHYEWYGKTRLNEQVDKALKEADNAM